MRMVLAVLAALAADRMRRRCRRTGRAGEGLGLLIELGIRLKVLLELITVLEAIVNILVDTERSALHFLGKAI